MIFHCKVLDISVSDTLYHFNGVARGRKEKEAVSAEVSITCPAIGRCSKNYTERALEPRLLFMWPLGCSC